MSAVEEGARTPSIRTLFIQLFGQHPPDLGVEVLLSLLDLLRQGPECAVTHRTGIYTRRIPANRLLAIVLLVLPTDVPRLCVATPALHVSSLVLDDLAINLV